MRSTRPTSKVSTILDPPHEACRSAMTYLSGPVWTVAQTVRGVTRGGGAENARAPGSLFRRLEALAERVRAGHDDREAVGAAVWGAVRASSCCRCSRRHGPEDCTCPRIQHPIWRKAQACVEGLAHCQRCYSITESVTPTALCCYVSVRKVIATHGHDGCVARITGV